MMPIAEDIVARLKAVVGPNGWSTDPARLAPHLTEWRGRYRGRSPLLLMPSSTDEVSGILAICHETATPLVPQGGNTGLVGGQIPDGEILLSLGRMNRIRMIDAANNALIAEAGAILKDVQIAAEGADRLYPLSLASEGSAMIGGLLSTNAGGINVLRYGMARDHVLGLEVVLADGRIFNGLKALRKDNTGYDLKQLFIGAEGTLGIITAAALRLYPLPRDRATAFISLRTIEDAVPLLGAVDAATGGNVTAFELVPRIGLEFLERHVPGARAPLSLDADWYVLAEISTGQMGAKDLLEEALKPALETGQVLNAAIARHAADARAFWSLRERLSEIQKFEGGSIKHDISVPLSKIAVFIGRASEAVSAAVPGIRPVIFGHIGDGNIHFNLSEPIGAETKAFLARWEELSRIVHEIAHEFGGSISAEHGLGQMKRDEIHLYKSAVEMDLMRDLKRLLDPKNILNPGKLVNP